MKIIKGEQYYTITEVAQLINRTRCTILRWYEFQDNMGITILPNYITIGKMNARYWSNTSVGELIKFRDLGRSNYDMSIISNKYNGKDKVNIK